MPGKSSILMTFLTGLWLLIVGSGLVVLLQYSYQPGTVGRTADRWSDQASLKFVDGKPNLLMFLHPKCPCSRASVREFEEIVARFEHSLHGQIVFVQPNGKGTDWVKTDLWDAATAIPRVAVTVDAPGRSAWQMGARTSGHTLLYDTERSLVFSGGITSSRGHEGDNGGRDSVHKLLKTGVAGDPTIVRFPVFGCPLFASEDDAS